MKNPFLPPGQPFSSDIKTVCNQGLCQFFMFLGVHGKGNTVLHLADKVFHGIHIIQIYEDSPINGAETFVVCKQGFQFMKRHPAAILFLRLYSAVIRVCTDIFQLGIEDRHHLVFPEEGQNRAVSPQKYVESLRASLQAAFRLSVLRGNQMRGWEMPPSCAPGWK